MRRSIFALTTGLAFAALACTSVESPPVEPAVDLAAEEQAIRALSMRWLELEQARNAAGIAALFAEDGMLVRGEEQPVEGIGAIEASLAEDHAEDPTAVTTWSTDRVEVAAAGDLAVEHGTWSATGLGADGSGTDQGKYVTVYRKVNGTWKVVTDVSVSTQAAGAATT